jgi:hypothetical protein
MGPCNTIPYPPLPIIINTISMGLTVICSTFTRVRSWCSFACRAGPCSGLCLARRDRPRHRSHHFGSASTGRPLHCCAQRLHRDSWLLLLCVCPAFASLQVQLIQRRLATFSRARGTKFQQDCVAQTNQFNNAIPNRQFEGERRECPMYYQGR